MNSSKNKHIKKLFVLLFIVALLTSIIAIYAPGTLAAEQSIVRVKLSVGTVTQFNFSLNGNYGIKESPNVILPSGSYSVKASGSTLNLYSGSTLMFTGADITVQEYKPSGAYNYATLSTTKYGTNKYRGNIEFRYNSGNIDVINHVYIEYYLYGVVPHEMSNTWPLEALKTQAVAARTYAKRYMDGGGYYDVVDTAANQVYKGFNPDNANAIRAVDETAKTVLTSGGELVQTYFAASNGGYVDIPQHVWSSAAALKPYHVVQADPFDTQNTWSLQEVLTFPKVLEGSAGIQFKYSDSGSMITGTGSEAANAERYLKMMALPAAAAKGYIASVTGDIQIVGISSIKPKTYDDTYGQHHDVKDYNGQNVCVDYTDADITMTVLAYRNTTQEEQLQTGQATVQEQVTVSFTIDLHEFDKSGGLYTSFRQPETTLRLITVEETDTSWNIYHRRYGHGVGMSQRGAQTRAKAGQTYQQILSFYYPNTAYQVLNISPPVLNDIPNTTNAVIVNCTTGVNIRKTPDTQYASIGTLPPGARITVTQMYATTAWHKIYYGGADAYVYAYYVKLDPIPTPTPTVSASATPTVTASATPTATATVTPTSTAAVSPTATATVTPTSTATVSSTASATAAPTQTVAPTATVSPTATATATPTATPTPASTPSPTPTKTPTPTPTPSPTPSIVRTGTVTAASVNIRSGAGSGYSKVGTLSKGSIVNIIALEPVKGWHKIWYSNKAAYVYADYVKLSSASNLPAVQATGTVTSSTLNVRSGPGTSYSKLGTLTKGAKVDITKVKFTTSWHQIIYNGKLGYVHVSYISVASTNTNATALVYATVNAEKLNMRSSASTGTVIATLSRGDIVQVLEKGSEWYKVKYAGKEGYMYGSYLKVQAQVYGKVNTSSLNVRSGASSSTTLLGKLSSGTTVEILEIGSTWHKIKYGASAGYVYAAYVDIQ